MHLISIRITVPVRYRLKSDFLVFVVSTLAIPLVCKFVQLEKREF